MSRLDLFDQYSEQDLRRELRTRTTDEEQRDSEQPGIHTANETDELVNVDSETLYEAWMNMRVRRREQEAREIARSGLFEGIIPHSIYGPDSREDPINLPGDARIKVNQISNSVCFVCYRRELTYNEEDYTYSLDTYLLRDFDRRIGGRTLYPCPDQRFLEQPCRLGGTGVLVGPQTVVTAGHVLRELGGWNVTNLRFVFGFEMFDKLKGRTTFAAEAVFSGAEVIRRPDPLEYKQDWAIIKLDRDISQSNFPAPMNSINNGVENLAINSFLFVLGHPSGLPLKYASGVVRDNSDPRILYTTLDTFAGNSGSPVFSLVGPDKFARLEGLLIAGDDDFVQVGDCYKFASIGEQEGVGAWVQRATEFAKYL